MAINHGRQMRPAIMPTRNMRHIHRTPFVTPTRPTRPASHPRAWGGGALMHEPPLLFHDSVHRLAIHGDAVPKSQQHPQPSIPERGMLLDEPVEPLCPRRVSPPACPLAAAGRCRRARLTPSTWQLRRSETPDTPALTRRMSSGLKGTVSRPPVTCHYRGRDPRSSV